LHNWKKRVLIKARGGAIKMSQSFADEDDPLLDIQKKHFFRKKGNKGKSSSVGR